MTNKLELTDILEVVKEKFKDVKIIDEKIYSSFLYEKFEYLFVWNNKIYLEKFDSHEFHQTSIEREFDNIIELKHYLGIDIKWEDLVEWAKQNSLQFDKSLISKELYISIGGIQFFEDGTILTYNDSISNRSYWQMYQIISSLTS